MKKIKLLIAFVFYTLFINAQSVYNFEAENIPYQNLTGSTSLNNGVVWDDPEYTIPLGFSFNIATYTFDTIYILGWSTGGLVSSNPVDGDIIPIFNPIAQDIIDLGFDSGISESNISYKTEGAAGSRILKLEWNNVGFFGDSTSDDFMNLQLWLYEGSNTIEYHYGASSINNPLESFEDETGPLISMGTSYNSSTDILEDNGYFLSEDPIDPTIIILPAGNQVMLSALDGMMPSGSVYRFLQQPLSVPNFDDVQFLAYPNPATHTLNFKTTEEQNQVSIFNSVGQLIKQVTNVAGSLDVSELQNGVYFLQLETSERIAIQKFIKQ
ncbi:T9SS type A sorting domain-containing protein [Aequorivita antarctica]|uniref:T9SS type A sorting domain-containing protein n=1 Tax=Aequorivita antarctica TaxID=153266 RepID=A0A5C6Z0Q4_9FLAO|nr:T9SS type A sorting domain-containing protein [Aequorivita antarctica]TXD73017.1 T9SS type A sorting domain-containing protein [Aequorivita antarctica]SRX74577.1 hypothetical protein AEQU3_01556 [Aequorivita antarctica]